MFLKKGHVLYSLEEKDKKQTYYDTTKEEYDKNVVVLIDRKTASASEILASSLKESYGAIVVGTTLKLFKDFKEGQEKLIKVKKVFTPNQSKHQKYLIKYEKYKKLYEILKEVR